MNFNKAKEELEAYIHDWMHITQKINKISLDRERLESIGNTLKAEPIYHDRSITSRTAEAVIAILDSTNETAGDIIEAENKCKNVLYKISMLPEKLRNVLYSKYILGYKNEMIGKEQGYTEAYVKELNVQAINKYAELPEYVGMKLDFMQHQS